jgi:hypothetical protein
LNHQRPALLGVTFVVVLYVGEAALGGNHPDPTESGGTIVRFYQLHREGALVSGYLEALAMLVLVWFAVEVGDWLNRTGRTRLHVTLVAGAVLTAATYLHWLLMQSTLAFGVTAESGPELTQAFYQTIFITQTFVMFPAALLVGAGSVAAFAGSELPRWYGVGGCLTAFGLLVSGADVARSGTFATSGDLSWLTLYVLFPVWVVTTGVLVSRRASRSPTAPARRDTRGEERTIHAKA